MPVPVLVKLVEPGIVPEKMVEVLSPPVVNVVAEANRTLPAPAREPMVRGVAPVLKVAPALTVRAVVSARRPAPESSSVPAATVVGPV